MTICRLSASVLLMLSCLVGSLLAQTYQYSVGWTNGRKRAVDLSTRDAVCQLQRLKNIMEGKYVNQLYWPCDWQNVPSAYDIELRPHGNQSPQSMASPTGIDEDGN